MRKLVKRLCLGAAGTSLVLASLPAAAQVDVEPPMPNVLLMIDSSGSMEYMPDGTLPAVCDPSLPSDLNRWGSLIEVLTGTVQNRGCVRQDRSDPDFITEYSLGGISPYDAGYFVPYHRYSSNSCLPTPGAMPANVFDWSPQPIAYRPDNSLLGACANSYQQTNDGLLDTYRDRVRFGMFTFDSIPDPGTGVSGGSVLDASTGIDGLWSYYDGYLTGGTPASGNPPACASKRHEVGARNYGAPPWEGRMIPFGNPASDLAAIRFLNGRMQEGLLAMRPYGATPLAGMMADAHTFFRQDLSADPHPAATWRFAPAGDPFIKDGCRDSFIILLSDGEPNLDLRPHCEAATGVCPYDEPHEYAKQLNTATATYPQVKTFTVGFGLSTAVTATGNIDCNTLSMPADLAVGGTCDGATGTLKACCTLMRIAFEGGTQRAYFADDIVALRTAIATVLDQVTSQTTSRTAPVAAAAGATLAGTTDAPAVQYEFGSAFTPAVGQLWKGTLERKRWECVTNAGVLSAELNPLDTAKGDDFALNVNQGKMLRPREFATVIADSSGGQVHSTRSIRPALLGDDGLGLYGGATVAGGVVGVANAVRAEPSSMGLNGAMPATCSSVLLGAATVAECADRLMTWELGGSNGGGLPSRSGNEFGAIYHTAPLVVGAPSALIRDPAYDAFAQSVSTRPLMLYAQTVDGQLHAFKVTPNDATDPDKVDQLRNNELWSFIPPAVLPRIIGQYPAVPQILLDGPLAYRDIPFERTLAQAALGGGPGGAEYRTVLVGSGGLGGGFYYALDVTDPTSPTFLWQLSTDNSDDPLFSDVTGTPSIALVSLREGGSVKEVAVAILPGGFADALGGSCPRQDPSFTHIDVDTVPRHRPRPNTRCWPAGPSRSVTVVRLETGEVLRSFRSQLTDGPASLDAGRTGVVALDAPILGAVPFPDGIGQVANRAYLNDADGAIWRLDLASPVPANWTVDIFFDAYTPALGDGPEDSQPIAALPVVSADGQGNSVVLFATGNQDEFLATNLKMRAWAVVEKPVTNNSKPFTVESNWYVREDNTGTVPDHMFAPGEKVTGPITVFNGRAFFSTFTPPTVADACAFGRGRVWGVRYKDIDTPIDKLPDPGFTNDTVFSIDLGDNVTPFGAALSTQPGCFETASVTDDYVGQHSTIAQSVPPVFKLRFQTGLGGAADPGSKTNVVEVDLPQPTSQGFIDSWGTVDE